MNLPDWLARHRRSLLTLAAALALAGLAAATSLPITLYPDIAFPRLRIDLDAGSLPAAQTVSQITQPVEQAVRAVPGAQDVTSVTSRGAVQIIADFGWGADMTTATLEVQAALAPLLPAMPAGTAATVLRMDPSVFPFMAFALTAPSLSQVKLRALAQTSLVPLLSAVPGIARVQVQGGETGEIEVRLDPHRLAALHLTDADIARAVAAAGTPQTVGQLQDRGRLYLLVAADAPASLSDVKNIPVRGAAGGLVRLADVADIRPGTQPQFLAVTANGAPAVTLLLFQQPGSNAVSIAAAARAALAGFAPQMPAGVALTKWYDQSVLVLAAAASVRDAILVGILLAGLVLMVFLRSWRITLVALLVVPAALAAAILLLSLLGMSFNIMTLGGLAAAVGLVIDDVIVMIEHIAHQAGADRPRAGLRDGQGGLPLRAGVAFLRPLTASSAATLIVFAPLAFLTGVTGAFFRALSITMAATLVASWLLAAFAVPLIAGRLIRLSPPATAPGRLARWYRRLLEAGFARPWAPLGAVAALLVIGLLCFTQVQTGFMPHLDEGGFVMDYRTDPGTSLPETARQIARVEALLRADPAVEDFSTRIGAGFGGDFAEPNQGDIVVRLTPPSRRDGIETVMARLAARIAAQVPGVDTDIHQLMGDEIGDLTGVPQPIEVKLAGADPAALAATAARVAAAISGIAGVDSVVDGIVPAGDAIDIDIDPVRAALLGLDPAGVAAELQDELSGVVATHLQDGPAQTGLRVGLDPAASRKAADLPALPLALPNGALTTLGAIATFSRQAGQPEITRENLRQIVAVTGRIDGRGIGAVIGDVRTALARPGLLAPGVTYTLGGLYQQQQIAFAGLTCVLLAALVAEFLLLLFLYESFKLAAAIIATALIAASAVFIGLDLTGIELNITALMGMTMIVGIATEMAIFYVSEFTRLAAALELRAALLAASENRLRPIAMTTLAAILTLLPLALDIGQGAGMQQPLAIAIIAGLLVQFPLVLLALPVTIWLLRDRRATI